MCAVRLREDATMSDTTPTPDWPQDKTVEPPAKSGKEKPTEKKKSED